MHGVCLGELQGRPLHIGPGLGTPCKLTVIRQHGLMHCRSFLWELLQAGRDVGRCVRLAICRVLILGTHVPGSILLLQPISLLLQQQFHGQGLLGWDGLRSGKQGFALQCIAIRWKCGRGPGM